MNSVYCSNLLWKTQLCKILNSAVAKPQNGLYLRSYPNWRYNKTQPIFFISGISQLHEKDGCGRRKGVYHMQIS